MLIAEIFYSIQGEGELTGVPSLFIRTSGCNLRCNWCDTAYASWEPEGREMSIQELMAVVTEHAPRHVVFTGGEPMVARGIKELASELNKLGIHITIESAGTIEPGGIACDLASISPKLTNSTPDARAGAGWIKRHEETRLNLPVLRDWITRYPFQLKFVVSEAAQIEEIQGLIEELAVPISAAKILLMPEGLSEGEMRVRQEFVVAACKQYGFRYCDRLHVRLFGHIRGT